MNNYIFWVAQVVTTIAIGAIAYFLKDIKKTITEDIAKNEARTCKLEEEVHRMPEKYVLKDDYQNDRKNINYQFGTIDAKLDRIMDKLIEKGMVK
ncbi:MAG: hypothetical protein BWY15_00441 [Firmicutes bacterium ADurb.Bin193]|nr:MAG: hypothetical protein BWY15_00441 [Firmicutes bacterium ADurb.Bin193]